MDFRGQARSNGLSDRAWGWASALRSAVVFPPPACGARAPAVTPDRAFSPRAGSPRYCDRESRPESAPAGFSETAPTWYDGRRSCVRGSARADAERNFWDSLRRSDRGKTTGRRCRQSAEGQSGQPQVEILTLSLHNLSRHRNFLILPNHLIES